MSRLYNLFHCTKNPYLLPLPLESGRQRKGDTRWKIKHCISHVASCLLATRKETYFTGCRPVETNPVQCTKHKIKVSCRLADEQTNTKNTKHNKKSRKGKIRACVSTLNRVESEVPFSVSVAPPFFPVSPTLLAALPDQAQRKPSCRSWTRQQYQTACRKLYMLIVSHSVSHKSLKNFTLSIILVHLKYGWSHPLIK